MWSDITNAPTERYMARHVLVPVATLVWLAKSQDRETRLNVAGNPRTPRDVLEGMLLVEDDKYIKHLLVARLADYQKDSNRQSDEEKHGNISKILTDNPF